MKVHTLADCMPAGLVSEKIGFKHGLLGSKRRPEALCWNAERKSLKFEGYSLINLVKYISTCEVRWLSPGRATSDVSPCG